MPQKLMLFLFGLLALTLGVGAFKNLVGAGTRKGTQTFLAACWWVLMGAGLVFYPLGFSVTAFLCVVAAAPFGLGWALAASANRDRMLSRH